MTVRSFQITCLLILSGHQSLMSLPRLVARSLIQRRVPPATPTFKRYITTPPPPPPPNPTSSTDPLTPKPLPSLDISPIEAPAPRDANAPKSEERTGARSAKDSLSTIERKRRAMARWTVALAVSGVLAGVVYMGRDWESEEEKSVVGGGVSSGCAWLVLEG
jgi:import inner membrane translocase subunit TIM50